MTKEIHQNIRDLMRKESIWEYTENFTVYKTDDFINKIGENKFSDELKTLLRTNVKRIQKYFDNRILDENTD